MKRVVVGIWCLCMSGLALATGTLGMPKNAELSMLVDGSIELAPDGSLHTYALDRPEKLPAPIVELIQKVAPTWHFKPVLVDGLPVAAKGPMHLRIVATRQDDGNFAARIAGATFGGNKPDLAPPTHRPPPRYPPDAVAARVQGTVYLLVRVGSDGKPTDVAAQQVNLRIAGSDATQLNWRHTLAGASITAVKQWTFNRPASVAGDGAWLLRVPITFNINDMSKPKVDGYGMWETYIPGPKESIPWADTSKSVANAKSDSVDSMPDGIYLVGDGFTLETPLDRS
jgi:hypothetical protein